MRRRFFSSGPNIFLPSKNIQNVPKGLTVLNYRTGSLASNDNPCVFLTNDTSVKRLQSQLGERNVSVANELSETISSVVEAPGDELSSRPDVKDALARVSTDFASVFAPIPSGDPSSRLSTILLKSNVVPKCKRPYHFPPDRKKKQRMICLMKF